MCVAFEMGCWKCMHGILLARASSLECGRVGFSEERGFDRDLHVRTGCQTGSVACHESRVW